MNTRSYLMMTSFLFALIAVVHLVRFISGWSAQVGTMNVPLWMSLLAVVVSGGLAAWGANLMRRTL